MTPIEIENKAVAISMRVRNRAKLRQILNRTEPGGFFRRLHCYAYAELVRRRKRK